MISAAHRKTARKSDDLAVGIYYSILAFWYSHGLANLHAQTAARNNVVKRSKEKGRTKQTSFATVQSLIRCSTSNHVGTAGTTSRTPWLAATSRRIC